jgi:hypothetical protein
VTDAGGESRVARAVRPGNARMDMRIPGVATTKKNLWMKEADGGVFRPGSHFTGEGT